MWFLHRLGQNVAERKLEIRAVILPALMGEHWQYAAYRVFPDCLLILHLATEWSEFGNARTLAHAEFDAPVAHKVQAGDLFCNPCRMVGGELYNPVAQADILRPLAC